MPTVSCPLTCFARVWFWSDVMTPEQNVDAYLELTLFPIAYQVIHGPSLFLLSCCVSTAQDDWEGSWPNSGSGGKVPPARQSKGGYREHPYGRY